MDLGDLGFALGRTVRIDGGEEEAPECGAPVGVVEGDGGHYWGGGHGDEGGGEDEGAEVDAGDEVAG